MPSVTVLGQRRAVAELDATIGCLEEQRREQLAAAARAAAAGRGPTPLRAGLRLAEDYLACLRQGRAVRLGELPAEAPGLAAAGERGAAARGRASSGSLSRPSWPARRR